MPEEIESLQKACLRCRRRLRTSLGAAVAVLGVFASMGLMQLNVERRPPERVEPISQFHLPPPPPPRESPDREPQPQVAFEMELNFDPADMALEFIPVEFGLTAEKLVKAHPKLSVSLDEYKTGGIGMMEVFEQSSLTEKPERRFTPPFRLPGHLASRINETIRLEVIYIVTKEGRATNVHALDCPIPELVPFIKEYVGKWRFTPPNRDGKPVRAWARHSFVYRASAERKTPFSL